MCREAVVSAGAAWKGANAAPTLWMRVRDMLVRERVRASTTRSRARPECASRHDGRGSTARGELLRRRENELGR